ncbi:MAG: VIT domain-containing protein [Candidatus Aminicenantaceae bacterium]
MRKNRTYKLYFFLFLFLLLNRLSLNLFADGVIIPVPRPDEKIPPLSVKYHRVNVKITSRVAKTSIDQVFVNTHNRDIEGIFIFPIPEEAAISEFSMYIDGKEIKGEILDRDKARSIYQDIVRRMKDPALLEYIGRDMFRARIFPIPARGEKRIKLTYSEVLKTERDFIKYRYPLNTERFSLNPIKEVTISVEIKSKIPLSNLYSPSHKISVKKESEFKARVGFEGSGIKPDKDFVLYFSLSQDDIGLSLLNYEAEKEGYYMLLASPHYSSKKEKVLNKNIIIVLDSSGSMSGEKIVQAKDAVRFIINHLDEKDMFSIVDFDDSVDLFSKELVPANSQNRSKALVFVDDIEDSGGTNINEALIKALKMTQAEERPNYVLFLTDGLPTVGITETREILKNIARTNMVNSRVFVFGVGYDVNTELLDRISSESRGTSVYVGEKDNLEFTLSNYYEKISSPLLSDLKVSFKGIEVKDSYPRSLPDLFRGSQLVILGKFKGKGPVSVILSGKVVKKEKKFILESQALIKDESYKFLPRLWATRRIGYLLEEIRLSGEKDELVEEVKKLGLKFGIVTPYTSFLVTEKERLSIVAAAPEAEEALKARQVTGAGAVKMAKATQIFKKQDRAAQVTSKRIKYKEDKTFYFKDGYWIDSLYEEGSPVREITFNSEDYFRLLFENSGIAKYLSVAKNLIVTYEGVNYKISDIR